MHTLHGHRDVVACGHVVCPSGHVDVRTWRVDVTTGSSRCGRAGVSFLVATVGSTVTTLL